MARELDELVQQHGLEVLYDLFPNTTDVDLSEPDDIFEKLDGSLITTYIHNSVVMLKSKGSLSSDQAIDSMEVFNNDHAHRFMRETVSMYAMRDNTVIMEYTAPDNRIVLGYDRPPKLTILAIRNNATGLEIPWDVIEAEINFDGHLSINHTSDFELTMETFTDDVRAMKGIEGFIVLLKNKQRIKFKTEEYFSLHKTKDNINSPRKLYECVLREASDDLKSMFSDDALAVKLVVEMEAFVHDKLNGVIHTVETFYNTNKDLERKDYAILGQKELDKPVFSLAMNLYYGHDVNYQEFMIKQWKHYGVTDG